MHDLPLEAGLRLRGVPRRRRTARSRSTSASGTVEACASCHRNHGTPYQWEKNAERQGQRPRSCIDCHMAPVERAVAVGGPVRRVRSAPVPGVAQRERRSRRAYSLRGAHRRQRRRRHDREQGRGPQLPDRAQAALGRVARRRARPRGQRGRALAHGVPRSRTSGRTDSTLPGQHADPRRGDARAPRADRRRRAARSSASCTTSSTTRSRTTTRDSRAARDAPAPVPGPRRRRRSPSVSEPEVASRRRPRASRRRTPDAANLVDYARPAIGKVDGRDPDRHGDRDVAAPDRAVPVPRAAKRTPRRAQTLDAIGAPGGPAR